MDIYPTDRTWCVLALARETANAHHAQDILTEHILYALIMEGTGIAANRLANAGVTFGLQTPCPEERDHETHERLRNSGRAELQLLCGEARQLMERAEEEAWDCRKNWPRPDVPFAWIGTEHILLSLTKDDSTGGAKLLKEELAKAGMTLANLRDDVLQLITGNST